jgi:hypothetical protein
VYDGTLYNFVPKGTESVRTVFIRHIIADYEKINTPEMYTTLQDYLNQRGITFGNLNGSGRQADLYNFLVKQTNRTIFYIHDNIIKTLHTDYQLVQSIEEDKTPTLSIIDVSKYNKSAIYNKGN